MIHLQDQNLELDVVEKEEDGEEEPTSCFFLGLLLPGSLPVWDGGGQAIEGCGSVSEMKSLYLVGSIHNPQYKENFYSCLGLLVHAQLC